MVPKMCCIDVHNQNLYIYNNSICNDIWNHVMYISIYIYIYYTHDDTHKCISVKIPINGVSMHKAVQDL